MNEVKQIGNYETESTWDNPQTGGVYSADGISPTLNTCNGGDRQPKIVEPMIVASRGRNQQNPSDRTPGNHVEQRLEPNSEGICNTLTSVQKDNLVLEPRCIDFYNKNIRDDKCTGTITTNSNFTGSGVFGVLEPTYRIRKLTPKECWRLMDFTDEDFHKAEAVNSNTQLYKQAGNSIVKAVLMAIFKQMI